MWLISTLAPAGLVGRSLRETSSGVITGKTVIGADQTSLVLCGAGLAATGAKSAWTAITKLVTTTVSVHSATSPMPMTPNPWLLLVPDPARVTVSRPRTGKLARPQKPLPLICHVVGPGNPKSLTTRRPRPPPHTLAGGTDAPPPGAAAPPTTATT